MSDSACLSFIESSYVTPNAQVSGESIGILGLFNPPFEKSPSLVLIILVRYSETERSLFIATLINSRDEVIDGLSSVIFLTLLASSTIILFPI